MHTKIALMDTHFMRVSPKKKKMIRPLKYLLLMVLFLYETKRISSLSSLVDIGSELDDDSDEEPPSAIEWNYRPDKGPRQWTRLFPYQCGGYQQSPIAIETPFTQRRVWSPLELRGYSHIHGKAMTLTNNGHTVQLNLHGNYTLQGGGLEGIFTADQIHFHWGPNNHVGSEHVLDRRKYPAEMHIVHHDVALSTDYALHTPGGIAVLGVFFEIGEENGAFEELVQNLHRIKYKDESILMSKVVRISDLLPQNLDKFYRYFGSTTTPPCYEVVQWTVFKDPITVSHAQMQALRGLFETRRHPIRHLTRPVPLITNYRPQQSANGRTVYRCGF